MILRSRAYYGLCVISAEIQIPEEVSGSDTVVPCSVSRVVRPPPRTGEGAVTHFFGRHQSIISYQSIHLSGSPVFHRLPGKMVLSGTHGFRNSVLLKLLYITRVLLLL